MKVKKRFTSGNFGTQVLNYILHNIQIVTENFIKNRRQKDKRSTTHKGKDTLFPFKDAKWKASKVKTKKKQKKKVFLSRRS